MRNSKTKNNTKKMNPKSILIIGKRWFDRVNGNTYCSARIYFDGVEVARVPWTYGYGDYYAQAARDLIQKTGLVKFKVINKEANLTESLYQYCQRKKINLVSEHTDGLKRDMVQWGRLGNNE